VELRRANAAVSIHTFYYSLDITPDRFLLANPRLKDPLIDCPTAVFFRPEIAGRTIEWRLKGFRTETDDAGSIRLSLVASPNSDLVGDLAIEITCLEQHIEFTGGCKANQDLVLGQWSFFNGTKITACWAHHFRNRHRDALPYETYHLMRGSADLDGPKEYPTETPREMVKHFCPGNFISFDFVEDRHNWERYFDIAEAYNGLVEHSDILGVEGRPLNGNDYEFLRTRLGKWR
jgi:hypothetical protein